MLEIDQQISGVFLVESVHQSGNAKKTAFDDRQEQRLRDSLHVQIPTWQFLCWTTDVLQILFVQATLRRAKLVIN